MIEHKRKNGAVVCLDIEADFIAVIEGYSEYSSISVEVGNIAANRTMYLSYKDALKFKLFFDEVVTKMMAMKKEHDDANAA